MYLSRPSFGAQRPFVKGLVRFGPVSARESRSGSLARVRGSGTQLWIDGLRGNATTFGKLQTKKKNRRLVRREFCTAAALRRRSWLGLEGQGGKPPKNRETSSAAAIYFPISLYFIYSNYFGCEAPHKTDVLPRRRMASRATRARCEYDLLRHGGRSVYDTGTGRIILGSFIPWLWIKRHDAVRKTT